MLQFKNCPVNYDETYFHAMVCYFSICFWGLLPNIAIKVKEKPDGE